MCTDMENIKLKIIDLPILRRRGRGNQLNCNQAPPGVKATVWHSVLVYPVFKAGIVDLDS